MLTFMNIRYDFLALLKKVAATRSYADAENVAAVTPGKPAIHKTENSHFV